MSPNEHVIIIYTLELTHGGIQILGVFTLIQYKHSLRLCSHFVDRSSSEILLHNDPSIQPAELSGMNCPHVDNQNGTVCADQKHLKWCQLQPKQISATLGMAERKMILIVQIKEQNFN